MALKRKLSKTDYEKLSADLKLEYAERDGDYILDIDGDEDTGALKRAKDREVQLRKDAETRARDLEEQLASISDVDARKKGDIETLEKSWRKKAEESEAGYKGRIDKLTSYTVSQMIDGASKQIADKISTVPALMSRAIRDRLSVDFDGDTPTLRVLDASGKPSAMTLDELSTEFVANREFSSIIMGPRSSGGGALRDVFQKAIGSASGDNPVILSTMSPRDLAERIRSSKESN